VLETARDRARAVNVRRSIPIQAPRFWPVPLALAIAFAAIWVAVPPFDLTGRLAAHKQVEQQRQELQTVKAEIKTNEDKLKELLAKASVDLKDKEKTDADEQQEPKTPEEIRRTALKRLTSLNDKLADLKNGEKAAQTEAVKDAMRKLKQPGPGPMEEMSRQMARGDFAKAKAELDKLSQKLQDGSMSPEQKEQMKEQLQKLAQQLDKLGKDKSDTEKKLQQAGLSKEQTKEAMKNPENLKKALEQLKNLPPEQQKELMKQAQAAMKAGQQCQNMGEQMSKMAQGMGKEGMSEEGKEGMKGMEGQLSEAEQMSADLEGLEAAMGECQGQLAKLGECMGNGSCNSPFGDPNKLGQWKAGDTAGKNGMGSGGPGRSNGGNGRDQKEQDFTMEKVKAPVKTGNGPIIGSRTIYGEQVKGSSSAEFAEAVESSVKSVTESMEGNLIPREHHKVVKHYFGHLEEQVAAKKADGKPAEAAKDSDKK
jgi:hypothetical protein